MYNNRSKGFTLIELLVVIAIIGVLSAVVLASLQSARNKGGDAGVQANLDTARTQAEVVASGTGNGSYAGVCGDATVLAAIASAEHASGALLANRIVALGTVQTAQGAVCHSSAAGFVISAPSKTSLTNYWCVDSAGNSKYTANVVAINAVACP